MAGGFAFRPEDHDLVDFFLRPKLAGQPLAAGLIHDVDVYSAAPDQLVADRTAAPGSGVGDARVRYLFSPVRHCAGKRKARTAGADGKEWWHSDAGQKTVKGSAALQFLDSRELDNLSGGEPRAPPPSPAAPCPVGVLALMSFDGVDMSVLQSFDDELPRAPPPSPAESETEGDAGVGLVQTTTAHGPCPDGVLALLVDEEELELGDELAPGESHPRRPRRHAAHLARPVFSKLSSLYKSVKKRMLLQ